jgi:hypothetical protein
MIRGETLLTPKPANARRRNGLSFSRGRRGQAARRKLVPNIGKRPGYFFLFFWHVCVASSQCIDFIPVHSAWVYMCDALEAFCFSFAKTGLTLKRSAVATNTNVDVFRDI